MKRKFSTIEVLWPGKTEVVEVANVEVIYISVSVYLCFAIIVAHCYKINVY